MLYRLSKRGQGRMPHVGSNLTDEKGLDLLHDWVTQLSPVSEEKGRPNQTTQDEVTGVLETLRESKKRTAEQRIEIYQGLFSSIRRAFIASRLVTEDPLLETIRQDVVQAAMAHADVHVRDLFERFVPEQHRIKRLGDVVDQTEVLKLRGDVENGRQFFLAATGAQCKNCHRVDGTSNTLGPDLSQIGKKYKPRELLESLVNPSQKIDPEYVTHLVVTSEGKILTGILAEKTEQYVVLTVFKDGKGELVRLSTEDVEELLPQKKSLMPERLLRDLTAQQAADLVAFLSSLKEASPLP
jgi:putative heme-binding domain-containing protein